MLCVFIWFYMLDPQFAGQNPHEIYEIHILSRQAWNLRRITEANDGLWNLITYCAATGGSLLVIGSAAGVAFMGSLEWLWHAMAATGGEVRGKWWNMESLPACLLGNFEIYKVYDGLWECDPWKADIWWCLQTLHLPFNMRNWTVLNIKQCQPT